MADTATSTSDAPADVATRVNDQGPHAYRPPGDGDLRSPCPALNTLSNHSYLPHDGRNISFSKIVTALREGMGLSHGFAIFMACGTHILLQKSFLSLIDLHDTRHHNYIEHDASIAHDDAAPEEKYAPIKVNLNLLHKFLLLAHPTKTSKDLFVITAEDVARGRIVREGESERPLDALHAELGRAEFAMVMEIFGEGENREVSREILNTFLHEERFPPGWQPTHVLHLMDAVTRSTEIRNKMAQLKQVGEHLEQNEGGEGWLQHAIENFKLVIDGLMKHKPEPEETKTDEAQTEETKAEETKTDETKTDEIQTEETQTQL